MVTRQIREVEIAAIHPHPDFEVVPRMTSNEWSAFYNDVVFNGIKVPLEVTGDGIIVDGHHRYKAAQGMGLKTVPVIDAPLGNDTAFGYMISAAMLRRHLDKDQLGILAAKWAEDNQKAHSGLKGVSAPRGAETNDVSPTRSEALTKFNVTRKTFDEAKWVIKHTPDEVPLIMNPTAGAPKRKLSKIKRNYQKQEDQKKADAVAPVKVEQGVFNCIVIDPPWKLEGEYDPDYYRGAPGYAQMSLEDISAMKIPADDNCVLWLWTTNAYLRDSFDLLEGWGFQYKELLTWGKNSIGTGVWLRGQTEHCLLAVKGQVPWMLNGQSNLLIADKMGHSIKPEAFYTLVDSLCHGAKLDMFARKPREGWEVWGNVATE